MVWPIILIPLALGALRMPIIGLLLGWLYIVFYSWALPNLHQNTEDEPAPFGLALAIFAGWMISGGISLLGYCIRSRFGKPTNGETKNKN